MHTARHGQARISAVVVSREAAISGVALFEFRVHAAVAASFSERASECDGIATMHLLKIGSNQDCRNAGSPNSSRR